MKITSFTIDLEPSIGEDQEFVVLFRNKDKIWNSNRPHGGMLPSEIRLVNQIQDIIGTYNSSDLRNK